MLDGEQQKREIETIKERTITVRLSDADCERVFKLCGEHNITVAGLVESFIGDLVGGTYTNGSDERDYARRYFERCWFGLFPETTLLNWLLNMDYDVYDDFLEIIENIENGKKDLTYIEKNGNKDFPLSLHLRYWKEYDEEEIEFLKTDIEDWEQQIAELKTDFLKSNEKADWEKEVEKVEQWWQEKLKF